MEAVILHHETTKKVLEYEKEQFYHYDFRPDAVGWRNGTSADDSVSHIDNHILKMWRQSYAIFGYFIAFYSIFIVSCCFFIQKEPRFI
jgi:hypothetical protein